mmetsp:Transcript_10901/g.27540  ORF Transcript_10901/g.27540 Transcript_10901/m.27540 type:complete len:267 (-) Transcript_10901:309-1109(-)
MVKMARNHHSVVTVLSARKQRKDILPLKVHKGGLEVHRHGHRHGSRRGISLGSRKPGIQGGVTHACQLLPRLLRDPAGNLQRPLGCFRRPHLLPAVAADNHLPWVARLLGCVHNQDRGRALLHPNFIFGGPAPSVGKRQARKRAAGGLSGQHDHRLPAHVQRAIVVVAVLRIEDAVPRKHGWQGRQRHAKVARERAAHVVHPVCEAECPAAVWCQRQSRGLSHAVAEQWNSLCLHAEPQRAQLAGEVLCGHCLALCPGRTAFHFWV